MNDDATKTPPELWPHLKWDKRRSGNIWSIHEPDTLRLAESDGQWYAAVWDGEWFDTISTDLHPTATQAMAALPAAIDAWADERKRAVLALTGAP